ncbi:putative FAD synthetase [Lasiosphaeria ovina]|uniref:FAD synthase n=1 Tax=Lasiosphaeria ovina TaxID=92902 RepID=A0AAE0NJ18_9PEZI|nr:putative FAD synthetase [Lasiosphaeria ovina]
MTQDSRSPQDAGPRINGAAAKPPPPTPTTIAAASATSPVVAAVAAAAVGAPSNAPPAEEARGGVAAAAAAAQAQAPAADLVATGPRPRTLPEICYTLRRKVLAFLDEQIQDAHEDRLLRDTQDQARVSMGVIEEALRRYGPEDISLAYNGGKDCLVLLVLILACLPVAPSFALSSAFAVAAHTTSASTLTSTATSSSPVSSSVSASAPDSSEPTRAATSQPPPSPPPEPLQAIYIAPPDPFPEVEEFVEVSTAEYHLDLVRYALPMRPALEAYLGDRPAVKAIFMGTRRTDPHSEFLKHFSPTDKGWPQFMRVNPVIDWHYAEIWTFIRRVGVPFCCLYQQGFSSLGGVTNTRPNPALALDPGVDGTKKFRPAYELVRDDEERLGRDR